MARSVTTAMLSAMNEGSAQPFFLAALHYGGGSQYLTTNAFNVTYGGNTYQAGAGLLGVGDIEEDAEMRIATLKLKLSGANLANISAALTGGTNGRLTVVYFGLLTATYGVIVDPFTAFRGRFDQVDIEDSNTRSIVTWTLRGEFADFERIAGRMTNDSDQQIFFPGDKGFEFAGRPQPPLTWGAADVTLYQGGKRNVVERTYDAIKGLI